ncbi:hypothetical protein ACWD4K_11980 [Streptomyces gelaticus]
MRAAIPVAPVALLGGALALTAPAALADTAMSGGASSATGFTVTPSVITPGSQVTLAARGCPTTATAGSAVFDTVTLPAGRSVTATVDWDAKPGASYEVTFICDTLPDSPAKSGLTIAAPSHAPTTGATVAVAGVGSGLGGGIGTMNAMKTAAGTALAVVAATGAVCLARRRGQSRTH